MFILGLTGSIGMGKSTTANFFREAGVPVHDSDAVVHRLYQGEAVGPVEAAFPGVAVDGKIDRGKLADRLVGRPEAIRQLESIVHPLVRAVSDRFVSESAARGARVIVLDIPLLFETGGEDEMRCRRGGLGAGRRAARARAEALGHDGRKARCLAGAADVGRGKACPRAFRGGQLALLRFRPCTGSWHSARRRVASGAANRITDAHARDRVRYRNHRARPLSG